MVRSRTATAMTGAAGRSLSAAATGAIGRSLSVAAGAIGRSLSAAMVSCGVAATVTSRPARAR